MSLTRSIVRPGGSPEVGTSPAETRLALAAFLSRAAAAAVGVRPGVLWGGTVSGTAGWAYSVAPAALVTSRGSLQGAYPAVIDGATSVPTDPAPASGSRIDIVYALQHDTDLADVDTDAILGVAIGAASGSPVAPSIPSGAMELARNTMTSTATTTASAGNTITQTAPITALHGATFEVPSFAALSRVSSPRAGDRAMVGDSEYLYTAGAWMNQGPAGQWQSYTPTLPGSTLGNGTISGRWASVGNTIDVEIFFQVGSTTSVGGVLTFGLPVTANMAPGSETWFAVRGVAWGNVGGGGGRYSGHAVLVTTTTVGVAQTGGTNNATRWGTGGPTPAAWSNTDRVYVHLRYEAS